MDKTKQITQLEALAKQYAEAHESLAGKISNAEAESKAVYLRHLIGLKKGVTTFHKKRQALVDAIEVAQGLFKKKKSMTLHGLKFGFKKGKGIMSWINKADVLKRIKKLFPKNVKTLIRVTEEPNKPALENLHADELKRLGIEVTQSGDALFIKTVDSKAEKTVKALLDIIEQEAA